MKYFRFIFFDDDKIKLKVLSILKISQYTNNFLETYECTR